VREGKGEGHVLFLGWYCTTHMSHVQQLISVLYKHQTTTATHHKLGRHGRWHALQRGAGGATLIPAGSHCHQAEGAGATTPCRLEGVVLVCNRHIWQPRRRPLQVKSQSMTHTQVKIKGLT
jgi:hypothetical protein